MLKVLKVLQTIDVMVCRVSDILRGTARKYGTVPEYGFLLLCVLYWKEVSDLLMRVRVKVESCGFVFTYKPSRE